MPPDTNLFTGVYSRLTLIPIYKQHGERGNMGVVRERERERTADDRVIKAELHPRHQAGRRATVHPSRLLLMIWVSKNLRVLSHPVRIHASVLLQQCWLLD